MFQRPIHCRVGHGLTNRHHPEESASRASSCCQRSWLWWQVHRISIRWQNYQGEVFQRLFFGYLTIKNSDQTGKMVFNCYYTNLPLEAVFFLLLTSTSPSSVELAELVYRAVWQIRSKCRCSWKRTIFPGCFFNLTGSIICFSTGHKKSCQRGQHGGKSKGECTGVT